MSTLKLSGNMKVIDISKQKQLTDTLQALLTTVIAMHSGKDHHLDIEANIEYGKWALKQVGIDYDLEVKKRLM